MIVIDENSQVINWLNQRNREEIGFVRLDLPTFEVSQGLEGELILIQDTIYHQMTAPQKAKLREMEVVIVFNTTSMPLQFYLENVIAEVNENTPMELITNQVLYLEDQVKGISILKSQLISLSHELNDIMGGVETQLLRVKKSYELTAPKRLENFKGLGVFSKYAAGENMGGEFFDIFSKENKIFMLMSASSSYLASSSILQYFSELKGQTSIEPDAQERIITSIRDEVEHLNRSKKKEIKTQLLTFELDINTMRLVGHKLGEFEVLSSNPDHDFGIGQSLTESLDDSRFEIEVQRGERLLFHSPGFVRNWNACPDKFDVHNLLNNKELNVLDILDETFFHLKKHSSSGFLQYDASAIILEVQENAILQI